MKCSVGSGASIHFIFFGGGDWEKVDLMLNSYSITDWFAFHSLAQGSESDNLCPNLIDKGTGVYVEVIWLLYLFCDIVFIQGSVPYDFNSKLCLYRLSLNRDQTYCLD